MHKVDIVPNGATLHTMDVKNYQNQMVNKRFTEAEWNCLMWAKSTTEVERILKDVYNRRVREGYPREGFDRLRECENELTITK